VFADDGRSALTVDSTVKQQWISVTHAFPSEILKVLPADFRFWPIAGA
jgi:hypothetical protein